jgi:oligoendopeptidase F
MRAHDLLDLDNRKGKAPGGYCETFFATGKPFIFMNAVSLHEDVQTMLHEGGHAFHAYECNNLSWYHQMHPPMEFAEVASMAMELLAAPYLTTDYGGFYSPQDAARASIQFLEEGICFWPYMAMVDAFQHWVYENPDLAMDISACDEYWLGLARRFQPAIDYTELEDHQKRGWRRKPHIFQAPFYYIEYGLAQLGAVQVWGNALKNQALAVQNYRQALALGGTANLPTLFATAGAKFAFDAETLGMAVQLMENRIAELRPIADQTPV